MKKELPRFNRNPRIFPVGRRGLKPRTSDQESEQEQKLPDQYPWNGNCREYNEVNYSKDCAQPPIIRRRQIAAAIIDRARAGAIGRDDAHDPEFETEELSQMVHVHPGDPGTCRKQYRDHRGGMCRNAGKHIVT